MDFGPPIASMYQNWFHNVAILVMAVLFYNFIPDSIFIRRKTEFGVIVGLLFSFAAVMGVMTSPDTSPHAVTGVASIIVPLAGFAGGPASACITTVALLVALPVLHGNLLPPESVFILPPAFASGILVFYLKKRYGQNTSHYVSLLLFATLVSCITVGATILFPPSEPGIGAVLPPGYIDLFFIILFGFFFLGNVIQWIDRRKESESELVSYKNHLEELVRERISDLERTSALKDATLASSSDGIVVVDLAGNIRDYNTSADNILGISKKEERSMSSLNIVDFLGNVVADRESSPSLFAWDPVSPKTSFTATVPFLSGRIFDVTITPFMLNDTVIGSVYNFRDITDKKRTEESLRNYTRKLLLLSNLARHDIRNQLTVLMGYLGIMEEGETNEEMKEYIRKEKEATQKINELIEFTSDYQDIGLNKPAWQDPAEAFRKACGFFSGSRIIFSSVAEGIEILADPMLDRVFYNLIDNSIRHGGHVTSVCLSMRHTEDSLILVYEDNGSGVAENEKEVIFSQGFGKNTGLGLFLIREILAITGISISETGTFGRGARFEMNIPKGNWRIAE